MTDLQTAPVTIDRRLQAVFGPRRAGGGTRHNFQGNPLPVQQTGGENLVIYNAKADQHLADCERMGRDQMRADLAQAEQDSVFNRSRWFDAFLAVFGAAVGLALVMA